MKGSSNKRKGNTVSLLVRRLAVLAVAFSMLITSPGMAFMSYATDSAADKQAATQTDAAKDTAVDQANKNDAKTTEEAEKESQKEYDDSDRTETTSAETENGVMEVSSETGSYTVDFYYTPENGESTEYHLKGGSEIMLSELFAKLGIDRDTADIKETVFTDNELVKFVKEGDDYRVISLKPFDTTESLTITFEDGEIIVIDVEDATPRNRTPNSDNNINWNLASDGTLTIKATNTATTAGFAMNRTSQANWNSFWATAPNASTTIRNEVTKVVFTTPASGVKINLNNRQLAYMFSGFSNLESVDFDDAITGTTTNIKGMFNNCPNLKEIKGLEQFSSDKLTDTGYLFYGCSSLTDESFKKRMGRSINIRMIPGPIPTSPGLIRQMFSQ